jgi:hypothetical protein
MPKNDIVRRRGDYPGEAGADWGFGATLRPEADEHYARRISQKGLRGRDKQRDLEDQPCNLQKKINGDECEGDRSSHQDAQHGAVVRGNRPMVQRSHMLDSLPEGLRRERKGPYDKYLGRNEGATHKPGEKSDPKNPKPEE